MYDINRKVYCKPLEREGYITERNWGTLRGKRRAVYIVSFYDRSGGMSGDFMCGSDDLIPYDGVCDGCGKVRRKSQLEAMYARISYDGEMEHVLDYCWFCQNVTYKDERYRY